MLSPLAGFCFCHLQLFLRTALQLRICAILHYFHFQANHSYVIGEARNWIGNLRGLWKDKSGRDAKVMTIRSVCLIRSWVADYHLLYQCQNLHEKWNCNEEECVANSLWTITKACLSRATIGENERREMLGLALHWMNEIMDLSSYFCGAVEISLLGGKGKEWFSRHAFSVVTVTFFH